MGKNRNRHKTKNKNSHKKSYSYTLGDLMRDKGIDIPKFKKTLNNEKKAN
tara:strand:+ start:351 stop:500 length:150 start_codon:yes stop_codon:yes gene_type:complete